MGLAATMGEVTETAGAGAIAVVAVLAPVLAGTAAAIFLLVGSHPEGAHPELAFAQTLLTAGWVFGAVTAAAILVAAVGCCSPLCATARPRSRPERPAELQRGGGPGREAWREALLWSGASSRSSGRPSPIRARRH